MKKLSIVPLAIVLSAASSFGAAFTPIPINPTSFNHDVVVEAAAPRVLSDAVTVTIDGGTNKAGNTFYERGYDPAAPTTGLPVAGSTISSNSHTFQMPPDYHVNNAIMVGHNNGNRTPLTSGGTLTFTTPAAYSGLSFLTSAGNAGNGTPLTVGYTIHYAGGATESGTFSSRDWFDVSANVYNTAGRVSVGGGIGNVGAAPAGALFSPDIAVGNTSANINSIDFSFVGAGANGNTNNNGRAVIFAVSGAKDGSADYTNTIAVTGFNQDVVIEADGPPTTGYGVAASGILTNNITSSMDGGLTKLNNAWYEKGFYASFPNSGLPAAGGAVTSATLPASYTMPASYTANNAVLLASNVTSASITFATPTSAGALSFLGGCANGDTFVPCVIRFADGTTENNTIFMPDWFNRVLPYSYLVFGRVNPNNRTINNTPDQFVNPFAIAPQGPGVAPTFDYRGLATPAPRLFDAVINVTNTSPITNITVNFTNGTASTRVVSIFAVSGAGVGNVPPVFGYTGTPTPGMPVNAALNAINLVKRWEGTNIVVLSVTNIAGTGPLSYQWKKAPRGGGIRDILYTFDYSTFANVVNGGRVSGATTSALVINNALSADSADYLVVVSNPYGAMTSTVATVEILTTNQSISLGVPAGDTIAPFAADSTPVAESLEHVIDRVQQKWLSDGLQWNGACCGGPLPWVGPVGFMTTPVSGASVVTSLRFYTANDSNGRDPSDYGLEGSNDGSTWTPITGGVLKGTLSLPTGRNGTGAAALDALNQSVTEVDFANSTGYKSYRVTITNNMNQLGDALMQIAEIELLGTFVPAPPVWVRQPDPSATVFVGASPTFVVTASGRGSLAPKYQWFKNGTAISGATGSAYTFPNAQLADSGSTFSATASNITGSTITSSSETLTVIAAPTQSYPSSVLSDNPNGYWRLNEPDNGIGNNGVAAHDYRGGHNGYYSNTVNGVQGYNPASDPDLAADFGNFANMDSYVADIKDVDFSRPANTTAGGAFSVEAWVLGGNQTVPAAIVTKGYNGILNAGTGTGTEQFVLDVTGNPTAFRFLVRDALGNGTVAQSAAVPYDLITFNPTWHHLLGVYDQNNGKILLYVDGLLAGSGTVATNVGILTQPLAMTIGARKSSGNTEFDNQWNGRIDDVATYNTALSAARALAHYYAAQRPPIITLQPTNTTSPDNVPVTFYSAAYGAPGVTFQWYLSDGVNPTTLLSGQTSPNLTFTTTPAQNQNNYQLVVTNPYGSTTGAVAQLTVVSGAPSFFTDLPASDTFGVGHVITLRVSVGGTAPFTYQWKKDGVNLSDDYRTFGSHTAVLTLVCAATTDSGTYQVLVSNGQGSTPSTLDVVTVINQSSSVTPFNAARTGWTFQSTGTGAANTGMGNNVLTNTSNAGNTITTAFLNNKVGVASFNASFVYQDVTGAGGADGVTFCFQNDPRGAAAIGGGGGSLGYSGITPSVALAMNIYDPNTRGIGFLQNGVLPAAGAGAYSPIAPVLVGGNANPIQVSMTYGSGVLSTTFRDTVTAATFTTNRTVDIPALVGSSSAYVGFTGADGGVASIQVISNFTMSPPAVTLKFQNTGGSLVISWPSSSGGCLRSTTSLTPPAVWTAVTDQQRVVGTEVQATITPLTGNKFYRLQVFP